MQLGKAASWVFLAICALAIALAACDPEDKPGTAIVLSVKSDIEELRSLQIKVLDSEDSKEDEADDHTVQTSFDGVDDVTQVVIKPGKSEDVLIVVSGFDGKRPKNALAEVTFRASFVQGKTLQVPVFLGNVCANEFCEVTESCSGGPLQEERECATIRSLSKGEYIQIAPDEDEVDWDWDAEALRVTCMDGGVWSDDGRCIVCADGQKPLADGGCPGAKRECDGASPLADGGCPLPVQECDGGRVTADGSCMRCADGGTPLADGGCGTPAPPPACDGGTRGPDGGCLCADGGNPLADGGCEPAACKPVSTTCDLFPQCNCKSGETCQHMSLPGGNSTNACRAVGSVPRDGTCVAASDCALGTTCYAGLCRAYCQNNSDCAGDGECSQVRYMDQDVRGVKVCYTSCNPAASNACARDAVCTNLSSRAKQFCRPPDVQCQFQEDGECDDLTGTRFCLSDPIDCAPRMCATPPPNPPVGTCDIVSQCGCERTQGCYASWQYGGATMAQCAELGDRDLRQGATCENFINGCAKGYACFSGRCGRYCRTQSDCETGTCQDVTVRAVEDAGVGVDAGIVPARGVKVCR